MKVYLGGPINGLTFGEASIWRATVSKLLDPLDAISPLRPFHDGTIPFGDANVPFVDRFKRDYDDVISSDAILFNMLGAKKKSIGTTCEIAWSYTNNIPVVVVMEDNNINQNPFLMECVKSNPKGSIVTTLSEGVNGIRNLFGLPSYAD